MLAGVEREEDMAVVHVVGGGDVDHVEARIGHQRLVAAVGRRDLPLPGEGVRLLLRARADGGDVLPGVGAHRGDELLGDPSGAEDAPAERGRLHRRRDAGFRERGRKGHVVSLSMQASMPFPGARLERALHRVDDPLVCEPELEVREAVFVACDALDQVAHLDHLDVEVAEAAAGEVEAEEGAELRHLAAGVEGLEAAVGLGVIEAGDLQLVEALAVHEDRALGAGDLPVDAEDLAGRNARGLDRAAGAAGEADERLDLVLVLDLRAGRVRAGLRAVAGAALRHRPRREEGLGLGDGALDIAHQVLGDGDHVAAEVTERARSCLLAAAAPGERKVRDR